MATLTAGKGKAILMKTAKNITEKKIEKTDEKPKKKYGKGMKALDVKLSHVFL